MNSARVASGVRFCFSAPGVAGGEADGVAAGEWEESGWRRPQNWGTGEAGVLR